jgi:hypothetical protein
VRNVEVLDKAKNIGYISSALDAKWRRRARIGESGILEQTGIEWTHSEGKTGEDVRKRNPDERDQQNHSICICHVCVYLV